jgi:nucleoside-diphosphate-sugar epimerase
VLTRPEAVGHSYNIGNPRSVITIHALAHLILRLSGSSARAVHKPWKFADVEIRIPNIDKARLLGFEPRIDLDEGLTRTLAWYREKLASDEVSS